MKINTNASSLNAQESSTTTNKKISTSLEKLSSGLRINKASDDSSGLAIADKLRTQATALNQSVSNGNSAIALLQIADKSMAEQSNILDTVKAKLIQANTDATSAAGRTSIAKDIDKLLEQLNNIAKQTNYNGTRLLQAGNSTSAAGVAASPSLSFQIGESTTDIISTKSIQANTTGYKLTALKTNTAAAATTAAGAAAFTRTMASAGQDLVDAALTILNNYRGDIGSTQQQVESAVRNISTQATNVKNAEGVIRDVDYAEESSNYSKLNIMAQAGAYAISQANSTQQNVLRLLQ